MSEKCICAFFCFVRKIWLLVRESGTFGLYPDNPGELACIDDWSTLRRVLCTCLECSEEWDIDHFRRMMKQCHKLHLPKTDIVSPLANIIFQIIANIQLSAFSNKMKTIASTMVYCMCTPPQNTSALQKGPWGLVRVGPGARVSRRSHPESDISNLLITELFYSQIIRIHRFSSYKKFQRKHVSVFKYRWTKNGFADPKSLGAFLSLWAIIDALLQAITQRSF